MSALTEVVAGKIADEERINFGAHENSDRPSLGKCAARDLAQIREALAYAVDCIDGKARDYAGTLPPKLRDALSLLDGAPAKATVSVPVERLVDLLERAVDDLDSWISANRNEVGADESEELVAEIKRELRSYRLAALRGAKEE